MIFKQLRLVCLLLLGLAWTTTLSFASVDVQSPTICGVSIGYDQAYASHNGYDAAPLCAWEDENQSALADTRASFGLEPGFIAAKATLWTSTKAKTGVENAFGHWQKHGAEFPEFQNAKQYVEGAKDFFSKPPSGTLTKTRPNGDTLFYNPGNNTFGVQAADGAPRTMFRPTDGINYWNKQ